MNRMEDISKIINSIRMDSFPIETPKNIKDNRKIKNKTQGEQNDKNIV